MGTGARGLRSADRSDFVVDTEWLPRWLSPLKGLLFHRSGYRDACRIDRVHFPCHRRPSSRDVLAVEGDIPGAKALLEGVLDVRSRHLGPDHAQTQAVAARLAQLE